MCEGTVTEPFYFQETARLERRIVEIDRGGVPKALVGRAVEKKKSAEREAKARKDQNLLHDGVWCVFDVDVHPFVPEAKQQASDNGIRVALSNPCFDLWILLHFQDRRAHIERARVQHLCREHLPGYRKKPPCERLLALYEHALQGAVELDRWQESRGNASGNPSTGVYRLTQRMKGVAE